MFLVYLLDVVRKWSWWLRKSASDHHEVTGRIQWQPIPKRWKWLHVQDNSWELLSPKKRLPGDFLGVRFREGNWSALEWAVELRGHTPRPAHAAAPFAEHSVAWIITCTLTASTTTIIQSSSLPGRWPDPILAVPPYIVRTPHLHGAPTTEDTSTVNFGYWC